MAENQASSENGASKKRVYVVKEHSSIIVAGKDNKPVKKKGGQKVRLSSAEAKRFKDHLEFPTDDE